MRHDSNSRIRLGRKTHLAPALALVLSLAAGSMATAASAAGNPSTARTTNAVGAQAQAEAALAARDARRATNAAMRQAKSMGALTWYVSNCNDSGVGSLRYMLTQAASGDIIDLTTMSCDSITLSSGALIVAQDDLTLNGESGFLGFVPGTYIHGAVRVIDHTGVGLLTLDHIEVSDGHVSISGTGACIRSAGDVTLNTSGVIDCIAERAPGSTSAVEGGGIYASGKVILNGFSYVSNNQAIATAGNAYGGGIWAGDWVQVNGFSGVDNNTVKTETGRVYGGGIYGKDWVDVTDAGQVVGNIGEAAADYTQISGAGIYCETDSVLDGALIAENQSNYSGGPVYIGNGVGIYAKNGVNVESGTVIRDNSGSASGGAGISTGGFLNMDEATVSGNYGGYDAAIFAKGNVSIKRSTISGNRSRRGAAIKIGEDADTNIMIDLSTISGNEITESSTTGAALFLKHNAYVWHSTVTDNISRTSDGSGYGAGISVDSNTYVHLINSVIAENKLVGPSGPRKPWDVGAAQGASGASVNGGSESSLVTYLDPALNAPSSITTGLFPQLLPLDNNGGPTKTHLPQQDSPLVNAGKNGFAETDQRGFDRTVDGFVDIGSVELTVAELDRIFADDFDG